MAAPLVFFDIAAPDVAAQKAFYASVFGWEVGADAQFAVPVAGALRAALRGDPAEKVLYFGVEDINATLKVVEANGGKTAVPRFEVPGVVILAFFTDPAGNRLGLVETVGGRVKTP